jgi:hypothetical protein
MTDDKEAAPAQPALEPFGFYVASRASLPERPAMWRRLREKCMRINSTWIDEDGEGETHDLGELWERIWQEIAASEGVILYAKQEDFPLKGALIECGIALGMGRPVAIVLDCVELEPRSLRPLGSWAKHPACKFVDHWSGAIAHIRRFNADRRAPISPAALGEGEGGIRRDIAAGNNNFSAYEVTVLLTALTDMRGERERLREENARLKEQIKVMVFGKETLDTLAALSQSKEKADG